MKVTRKEVLGVQLSARERKLLSAATLMLSKCAAKGDTKMNTKKLMILLYFADVSSFRVTGKPITGYNWNKTKDGVEVGSIWRPSKRSRG